MARALRIEVAGGVYHVVSRGNARESIFVDDRDRERFLEVLAVAVERYGLICHAYCLMGNHYHLLVETPRANLSLAMRHLNGVYSQLFNRVHRRVGHLFQGRFAAMLIEKEGYLLAVARYVVRNPVRARLCLEPAQWRWSSYAATAGLAPCPGFLSPAWLLSQFAGADGRARLLYRDFVCEGSDEAPWVGCAGRIVLGSEEFIRANTPGTPSTSEIPRAQRQPLRPSLEELFQEGDQAVLVAYRHYGYRLNEIADHLSVHVTTASRWLRRLEQNA